MASTIIGACWRWSTASMVSMSIMGLLFWSKSARLTRYSSLIVLLASSSLLFAAVVAIMRFVFGVWTAAAGTHSRTITTLRSTSYSTAKLSVWRATTNDPNTELQLHRRGTAPSYARPIE